MKESAPTTDIRSCGMSLFGNGECFREVSELLPIMLIAYDEQGRIIFWNNACTRGLGYEKEEILHNEHALDMLYPNPEELGQVCAGPRDYSHEERTMLHADGELRIIAWSSYCESMNVPGWHHWEVGQDLTEQKRVEARIRRDLKTNAILSSLSGLLLRETPSVGVVARHFLKAAREISGSPHGFVSIVDKLDGHLTCYALQADKECVYHKPEDLSSVAGQGGKYPGLLGLAMNKRKGFYTNTPSSHAESIGLPSWHMDIDSLLSCPATLKDELVGQITVANAAVPYTDDTLRSMRRLANFFALFIQRRRFIKELERSHERFRSFVESTSDIIYILSNEGLIIDANTAAENLGFSRRELIGCTLSLVEKELSEEKIRQAIADAGQVKSNILLRGLHKKKDGTEFSVEYVVRKVYLEGQMRTVCFVRDLTGRVEADAAILQAKKQAQDASKAKSEFLANMSHEIRTPLNAVLGMADMLAKSDLNIEHSECVSIIQQSASHLLNLLTDVLDLSKIEARMMELEQIDFPLESCLNEAVSPLLAQAQDKGITLGVEVSDSLPKVCMGDPGRLNQILLNLVANALKFTDKGSVKVLVDSTPTPAHPRCHPQDDEFPVYFTVSDTGIGIDEDLLEIIFQSFRQADGSHTRRYGGTGLGLAISKELAALMRGSISVQSTPGKGTDFLFSICLKEGNQDLAGQQVCTPRRSLLMPADAERVTGAHILVVEDNPTNRRVARLLLERMGHSVVTANTGEEALVAGLKDTFDLILMDVEMPVMDGLEATRRIRRGGCGPAMKDIRIIAMTAHAMAGFKKTCTDAGMDDYLPKPVSYGDLEHMLNKWLDPDHLSRKPAFAALEGLEDLPRDILDVTTPLKRLGGDIELLEIVFGSFRLNAPLTMKELTEGFEQNDHERIVRACHSMKSTSQTIGAMSCHELAKAMEKSGKEGNFEAVREKIPELEDIVEKLLKALEPFPIPED